MDFLAVNLEALERRFPKAAGLIREAGEPEERRAQVSRQGATVYQALRNGRWVNITSGYNPRAEADRQREGLSLAEAKLVFVVGEAGLYHLESILEALPSDDNRERRLLLFSQHPEYLRLVLSTRDVRALLADERFYLFLDFARDTLRSALQRVIQADIYEIPTFTWFVHPVEEELQGEFCQDFRSFLRLAYTTALLDHHTTGAFEQWWMHNFVCNIPYLMQAVSLDSLAETWRGRPAIIVGAGPSLNKNIELLAEAKGRALILCVDTAYRSLAQRGIVPDLLVTLDGSPMNAEHMRETDYKEVPLLLDVSSHWEILSRHGHRSPKVVLSASGYHLAWWRRILGGEDGYTSLPTGGSVATAAFSFARHIGADPVILAGVDLSYPNGACYARGALHAERTLAEVQSERPLYPVRDIEGNTVMTTADYRYYLRWLHDNAAPQERRYINATEGGAVREGFEIKTLRAVLDEDCRVWQPVTAWKNRLKPRRVEPRQMAKVERNLRRSYREMKTAWRLWNALAAAGKKYLQQLEDGDYSQTDAFLTYLSRAQLKLNELSLALSFLDAHSYKAVYTDIKMADSIRRQREEHSDGEKLKLSARQTYNLILSLRDLARDSLPMHRDALASMESVLKEMTDGEYPKSLQTSQREYGDPRTPLGHAL
ncbi:6-hydroxymethylpterin diphosphokinase MptE-like [Acididesulfobacillus acetoxydans]|uniref:6-hydroxymethylpterin diphosphokinase MptE-like n=1 Tax=Acididesulfobacillus acetoxydans TaxID=1561005 RepID=A0A8S0WI92_9FIRM|nr:6-hydroxymethylpterin diphosphokinase MptE-like protein [Acididesulfobacillus acetoxydans]CAA7603182.1 6-hydroxymethylpterin diphosphokinase MptE-like [Acididesulfobacillus acetoxydans]CEJ07590.1 Protein of unknown function DUF115 [Acididesulfobacillus acetoxydans]